MKRSKVVTFDPTVNDYKHLVINKRFKAFQKAVAKSEPIHFEPVAVAAPVVSEPAPFEIKPMEKINMKGCFCLC